MKKLITIFSIILMLCACAFTLSVSGFAQTQTDSEDKLFLPGSYEQYLELTSPTDFAISDKYIAIADKTSENSSTLYLFNREKCTYKSHTVTTDQMTFVVSSLNFYSYNGSDYLFFTMTNNSVYYVECENFETHSSISFEDKSEESQSDTFKASALLINGDNVYYTTSNPTSTNVFYAKINGLTISGNSQESLNEVTFNTGIHSFSQYNGEVYFSSGRQIWLCSSTGMSQFPNSTVANVEYFAKFGENSNDVIYTDNNGFIYTGLTTESAIQGKNASVVKYYNGHVYFALKNSIVQYDIENAKFTDYEIGKYSDSLNRLNEPSDISAYGDKIVIADNGNKRVTIYDGKSYTAVTLSITPSMVCAGENNFLVINGATILVYDYSGVLKNPSSDLVIDGGVLSVTYSIGTYYIASKNGSTYSLNSETLEISDAHSPQIADVISIAADLYGNIYILDSAGQVYSYALSDFLSNETATGASVAHLDESCMKLLVDYDANLYGLSKTSIYIYKDGESSHCDISFKDVVFGGESKVAVSFALSLNDSGVYILSDGFIVRKELGISTLENISADGLNAKIYQTAPDSQNLIVSIPKGSVAVNLDITALEEDTEVLPYLSYEILTEDKTGVVLGAIDAGYVVAVYEYTPAATSAQLPKREYKICLISANNAAQPSFNTSYFTEEIKTGYVSSDVNLYMRPLMQDFAKIEIIEKNTAVSVLGKVSLLENVLDSDYYFVETANGNYGFIPSSFVTENAPVIFENENFYFQTLKNGKSATLASQTGESITLDNKEQLKVYDVPASQSDYKVVSYEKNGITYYGEVSANSLSEASSLVIVTLVIVMLVAASVILSTCYLLFRKKPTLE